MGQTLAHEAFLAFFPLRGAREERSATDFRVVMGLALGVCFRL